MTPTLPPIVPQPATPQSRDTAGALGMDTQRKIRAAREAETARALRPVDPALTAADVRLTTRRDQPVGPPPAFTINVLQHLREAAMAPPEVHPDPEDLDTMSARETESPAPADDPSPYARSGAARPTTEHQVDIKL
ncbi:hypothetical protein [Pararhodobacter sp. SW119]|uniref:hypothetical protein n=1 Tax=Pararhodobacter sp. SW119 TaxID=2780075 RepID=UPI001AE0A9C4|nr:hypothetical protein [Pararhodobacter sp. SW119]